MIFQKVLNFFSSNGLACTSFHSEPILNGYLVLEDLNKSYVHPCILDVKIGTRTYCTFLSFFSHPKGTERLHRKSSGTTACVSPPLPALSMDVCMWHMRNLSGSSSQSNHLPQSHDWLIEDKNETIVVRDRHILL